MKKAKRKDKFANLIDSFKLYNIEEASELVLKTKSAKFTESVDIYLKLGINPKNPEEQVKGSCVLPHGTGKNIKVLAIVNKDDEEKAKAAGADYAGLEEYIDKIAAGWLDFDVVVTSSDMMAKLSKVGKILGTKGLMPNLKYGNVVKDIEKAVREFKNGKVIFKTDKFGALNAIIGKADFSQADIMDNLRYFLKTILQLKPSTSKGQYLRKISVSLTMGPGVKVDAISAQKEALAS